MVLSQFSSALVRISENKQGGSLLECKQAGKGCEVWELRTNFFQTLGVEQKSPES